MCEQGLSFGYIGDMGEWCSYISKAPTQNTKNMKNKL